MSRACYTTTIIIYCYYIFMMMQLSIHSIALLIDRHHKPCILYYHKLQTVLITIFNSHFSLITNTIQLSRRDVEELLDFIQGYYAIESNTRSFIQRALLDFITQANLFKGKNPNSCENYKTMVLNRYI